MNNEITLEFSSSLFGQVSVVDSFDPDVRLLKINNEIEGQTFLLPSALTFSCLIDGPGAVSASRYLYGFIIAAWQFPDSHGLVLGLGAGAGVTMLLALFPKLTLTVIEIDPQLIILARRYFPLLAFYEGQGRLRIIKSDAKVYLERCEDKFAFSLLDLFSGDEENHNNLPLIQKALRVAPLFMANIITSKAMQPSIEQALNFNSTSASLLMWMRAYPAIRSEKINWIMTNINEVSPEILDYKLFADVEPIENIMTANRYFRYILSQIEAACFYRNE